MLRWISLFLILFTVNVYANCTVVVGQPTGAPPACTILESPIQTTYSSSAILGGDTAATQYMAIKFTAPSELTLRTVVLRMATDTNSPTEDVVVALCTDSGGAPNVCTNADSVMNTPGVAGYKYLRWSAGYEITNATVYHIRIYTAQDSNVNYYNLGYNNAVAGQQLKKGGDGISWSDYNGDNSAQGFFELSECVTYVH